MRALHLSLLAVLTLGACQSDVVEGTTPGDCTDGIDNDDDGKFDCLDDSCSGSPDCADFDPDGAGEGAGTAGGDEGTSTGGDPGDGTGGGEGTGGEGTGGEGTGGEGTGGEGTGGEGTGGEGTGGEGTGGETGAFDGGYVQLTDGAQFTLTHPSFGTDSCSGDFSLTIAGTAISDGFIENCFLTGDLAAFGQIETTISGTVDESGNVSGVLDSLEATPFTGTVDGSTFRTTIDATFTVEGQTITATGTLQATR